MTLYEVAIVWRPTEKQIEEGDAPVLLMKPTPIFAKNDGAARLKAVTTCDSDKTLVEENRDTGETITLTLLRDIDQLEVLVRPFC